jgi:hypothetical protein
LPFNGVLVATFSPPCWRTTCCWPPARAASSVCVLSYPPHLGAPLGTPYSFFTEWGHVGRAEVQHYSLLISTLDKGECFTSRFGPFTSGKALR